MLPHKYLLLEEKVDSNTKRIDELFDRFNPKVIVKKSIFFKGDIYDAYSVLLKIFNIAKEEIIIVDNYAGKVLLDELRNVDRKIVFHSGASFKDLGNKCFAINEIENESEIKKILENILKIMI